MWYSDSCKRCGMELFEFRRIPVRDPRGTCNPLAGNSRADFALAKH